MSGIPSAGELGGITGANQVGKNEDSETERSSGWSGNQDLFNEIVRLEQALAEQDEQRRRGQHGAFLAKLNDRLIHLGRPEEMIALVTLAVGEYLYADRCFIDEPGPSGSHIIAQSGLNTTTQVLSGQEYEQLSSIAKMLASGQQVVVNDVGEDRRFRKQAEFFEKKGIRAFIITPWVHQNRWSGDLTVTMQTPREWSQDECAVLQAITELTWLVIDNARLYPSLKLSEERLSAALNNSPLVVYMNDLNLRCTWMYAGQQDMKGLQMIGKTDADVLNPQDARDLMALKRTVLATGKGVRRELELTIGDQLRSYDMTIEPMRTPDGLISGLTVAASDISELVKLREEKRRLMIYQETHRLVVRYWEHERQKIALELHDGPLQEVMAIGFNLAEALQVNDKSQRVDAMLRIRTQLQSVAQELRQFCTELRPPALAPFGLEKAIRSHMQIFQHMHPGFEFDLDLAPDRLTLLENTRLGLYRIYQELINNAVRHSHAHTITVRLVIDKTEIRLEVQDDGSGVVLPAEWLDLARQGHFGLVGVRERAEALGGNLAIRSDAQAGTLAQVILPLKENLT